MLKRHLLLSLASVQISFSFVLFKRTSNVLVGLCLFVFAGEQTMMEQWVQYLCVEVVNQG